MVGATGLTIATLLAGPGIAAAVAEDAPSVLAALQSWLDGTRDLQGRFTQQLLSGALGSGPEESGRLYVLRPGRMRWEYTDPEPKLALLEEGRTQLYLEEDRQLILGRLEDESGLLPALLMAEGRLEELFEATLIEPETEAADGALYLRLAPRRDAEALEHITLLLRAPGYGIEAAEVLDSAGNRIVYRFWKLKRNRGVDEQVFEFEAPPGTEILGEP